MQKVYVNARLMRSPDVIAAESGKNLEVALELFRNVTEELSIEE